MSGLEERNAIRKVMAAKSDQIEDLTNQLAALQDKYNQKSNEFDALCVRYEDETGEEWDGRAFA